MNFNLTPLKVTFLMSALLTPLANAQDANTVFKQMLRSALEQSASVASQQAALDSAREARRSKSLYWTPTGTLLIGKVLTNNGSSGNASTRSSSSSGSIFNGSAAEFNLNIYKFGSNDLAKRAAEAKVSSESARLGQTKENFESAFADELFQYILQVQTTAIRQGHVDSQDQSLQVAKERYRQGQLAQQEVQRAQVDLDSAKVLLTESKLLEIKLKDQLKGLARVDPEQLKTWPYEQVPQSIIKNKYRKPSEFYSTQAFATDVDYFHRMSQQTWRSAYLPSLDIAAAWGTNGFAPIAQGQWVAGLTLTIPLWDQLAGSAQASDLESSARTARANHDQALRESESTVNSLDERINLSYANVEKARSAVRTLQSLRDDSLRRFRMGRSTVNDFLIDENRFLDAGTSLLNSMWAYHQVLVEVCHDLSESLVDCY